MVIVLPQTTRHTAHKLMLDARTAPHIASRMFDCCPTRRQTPRRTVSHPTTCPPCGRCSHELPCTRATISSLIKNMASDPRTSTVQLQRPSWSTPISVASTPGYKFIILNTASDSDRSMTSYNIYRYNLQDSGSSGPARVRDRTARCRAMHGGMTMTIDVTS